MHDTMDDMNGKIAFTKVTAADIDSLILYSAKHGSIPDTLVIDGLGVLDSDVHVDFCKPRPHSVPGYYVVGYYGNLEVALPGYTTPAID